MKILVKKKKIEHKSTALDTTSFLQKLWRLEKQIKGCHRK